MEETPKVYFTRKITSQKLVELYNMLNFDLTSFGKVAVKIHSGEHDKGHIIQPEFMKPLVDKVKGTIVECNTAYDGRRNESKKHWEVIKQHGFTKYFNVDILDEEGEESIPVDEPKIRLKQNFVGSHLKKYDALLVLSHFKGHAFGGFGGALKNISIGLASSHGKKYIHGAGDVDATWTTEKAHFHESMADAVKSVMKMFTDKDSKVKMAFISVMKDMSVDCDCNSNPRDPEFPDIGMLASLDPVALDQACVDKVYESKDKGKAKLIKRIESVNGVHTIESAELIGLGKREYKLIDIDKTKK